MKIDADKLLKSLEEDIHELTQREPISHTIEYTIEDLMCVSE